jgi:hypothetical protein
MICDEFRPEYRLYDSSFFIAVAAAVAVAVAAVAVKNENITITYI